MLAIDVVTQSEFHRVSAAAQRAVGEVLHRAATDIVNTERELIIHSPEPSAPGEPPHTREGALEEAIDMDVNPQTGDAVIGPRFSRVGTSAEAHEFGGEYRGQDYPERSFAGPALDANVDRFANYFAGSIGE